MAYCTKNDLRKGDIPLAAQYGDGSALVNQAGDEIDAHIGHLYVTPVVFADPLPAAHRPSMLMLKNINILLASGRLILDMAAGGEDNSLHAYGRSMWSEGNQLLKRVASGEIELVGAIKVEDENLSENSGPVIINEDPESLVKSFYQNYSGPGFGGLPMPIRPARPYGI